TRLGETDQHLPQASFRQCVTGRKEERHQKEQKGRNREEKCGVYEFL
ncbi:uncharacterized, partial [Tachysurus ichikawai]